MNSVFTRPGMRSVFENSSAYRRASVIIPFLAISIALGVLAWRSYHLSVRMEQGLNSFAAHYLAYAAEITARRTDVAAGAEMSRASERWQQIERTSGPDFESLQSWLDQHIWIVSAVYVPDDDITGSIFVTELSGNRSTQDRLTHEFYTATGSVSYTYDPSLLLASASKLVERDSVHRESNLPETDEIREHSEITLTKAGTVRGVTRTAEGYAIIVPLEAPLDDYGARASVMTSYASPGWENHRVISVWFAGLAIALVAVGAFYALRGIRKEAEAMNLRAALIANVSHELRTPLSMIRLGAETLKRSSQLAPHERTGLEDSILREVIHLSHLVENVLDVARLQRSTNPFAFVPLDPAELVQSVVSTYGSWISSRGFSIELNVDSSIGEQLWDREAVSRALLNLIDNAIKYSTEDRRLTVTLHETGEWIALAVRDHGVGISQRDLKRIFEPYYRAAFSDTESRRGAGLGLTLVQQIIRSHGGRIDVQSIPGEGSTFTLLFPKRLQGKVVQRQKAFKPSEASLGGTR
ncbi:MAG TPA: HAMP domain-containing sensor histidine kinase [Thermoanaerobaculia bacterium]|nr:HAMP domain-containing sensor histidine kinase [Thermoanaerobaculia bacterium]